MRINCVCFIYQFADIFAPDLSSARVFGHEGDTIELREEDVQTFHTRSERQVGAVQTGLYVVPAMTKTEHGNVYFNGKTYV